MIEDGSAREEDLPFGTPRLDPEAFDRLAALLDERPPRLLNALQRKRFATGLSQDEFAMHVGVSRQTISSIENGRTSPSVRLALTIAAALEASVEELFGAGHDAVAPPACATPSGSYKKPKSRASRTAPLGEQLR